MTEPITSFRGVYRFLSNFHVKPINFEGMNYPSTEHAYQAAKCADVSERELFGVWSLPGQAKKLGSKINIRPDWESVKLNVMLQVLRLKFNAGSELAEKLLSTGDAELIEGNNYSDIFWGQCPLGTGENHLGKLLMQVREELKGAVVVQ